jgi:hypothetical protein
MSRAKPETLEEKAVRLQLEAAQVDFRLQPERMREFQVLCNSLARSDQFSKLIIALAHEAGIKTYLVIAIMATGVSLGIDYERKRTTEPK